jgi:hypothetical protein
LPIKTFHPRVRHSPGYYRSVLTAFIDGLNRKKSDAEIAQLLTERGLLAPSGKPWTSITVKHQLYRLRHSQTRPSRLHRALLEFVFAGVLTVADSWVLFEPRPKAVM